MPWEDAWQQRINGRLTLAGAVEVCACDEGKGVCAIAAVCAKPPVAAGEVSLVGGTGAEGDAGAGALVGVEAAARGEGDGDQEGDVKGHNSRLVHREQEQRRR